MKFNKLWLVALLAFAQVQNALAQDPVMWGIAAAATAAEQAKLKEIKEAGQKTFGMQILIDQSMRKIKNVEEKMYDRLTDVAAAIKDIKAVKDMVTVSKDIADYQVKTAQLVGENPSIGIVAWEMEAQLVSKTFGLAAMITAAVSGGEKLLLSPGEREEIIRKVYNELRLMRAISIRLHSLCYRVGKIGVGKYILSEANILTVDRRGVILDEVFSN